jgi:predicted transcriptional regulator
LVSSGSWSRSERVRAAILALCAHEYLTVAEIAEKLDRKRATIQQNYVSKMLQEGLLEPRYSDTLSHPSQAYRARQPSEGVDP